VTKANHRNAHSDEMTPMDLEDDESFWMPIKEVAGLSARESFLN
jgi:hypothetical protein